MKLDERMRIKPILLMVVIVTAGGRDGQGPQKKLLDLMKPGRFKQKGPQGTEFLSISLYLE